MSKPITKLKKYREKLFMSQAELAKKAGVTQGTVSNAEAENKISLGSIKKLAEALKVPPEKLL